MIPSETDSASEYEALLRADFASFAQQHQLLAEEKILNEAVGLDGTGNHRRNTRHTSDPLPSRLGFLDANAVHSENKGHSEIGPQRFATSFSMAIRYGVNITHWWGAPYGNGQVFFVQPDSHAPRV